MRNSSNTVNCRRERNIIREPNGNCKESTRSERTSPNKYNAYKAHGYQLKTAWVDVKKAFDSVNHDYSIACMESLCMCPWITRFLKTIISKWNLEVRDKNEILFNKRVKRGILQGDSLSPLLFVLCLEPLSKRLNRTYLKIEIKMDDVNFSYNHLLCIDELKLLAKNELTFQEMIEETK